MIKEFSVKPKAKNNNAKIILFVTAALGAVAFLISMLIERYKGVVGLVALGFFCTAIFFYTKFISSAYSYDITFDSDYTAVFVVRQITGKRQTTMCRIALYEIESITKETKAERKDHKTPIGTRRYVYFPTVSPELSYRITSKNRYESSEILIEGTDEFISLLLEYVSEAKEQEKQNEEQY